MVVKINGVDITNYIAYNGLKWQRNDVDSPNAGRTLAATMVRDRVATKIRLDINCRPLTSNELMNLLNLIQPEYITVEYYDPLYGHRSGRFYSNNVPASYLMVGADGNEWWSEVSFPLVEV